MVIIDPTSTIIVIASIIGSMIIVTPAPASIIVINIITVIIVTIMLTFITISMIIPTSATIIIIPIITTITTTSRCERASLPSSLLPQTRSREQRQPAAGVLQPLMVAVA